MEDTMNNTTKDSKKNNGNDKNMVCDAHVCPHKMAFMLDNWFRKLIQNPKKVVGEYIKEGDTVIDFGCGPGFFSTEMAKMVGKNGKVIAADLQEEMLVHVRKKAAAKNVTDRMEFHRCQKDRVGIPAEKIADFMLAFYMIHETPNPSAFLEEVKPLLKEGGKFLVVEPKMHVSQELYEEMIGQAKDAGFRVLDTPAKKGGRSVLLTV